MFHILTDINDLLVPVSILVFILICLAIILCLYAIIASKKVAIVARKFDYFIEDLTYKSEMLNASVDTIVKMSNYIDIFEAFTKRNLKAWVKVIYKNRDIAYKLVDKLKDFANSEE